MVKELDTNGICLSTPEFPIKNTSSTRIPSRFSALMTASDDDDDLSKTTPTVPTTAKITETRQINEICAIESLSIQSNNTQTSDLGGEDWSTAAVHKGSATPHTHRIPKNYTGVSNYGASRRPGGVYVGKNYTNTMRTNTNLSDKQTWETQNKNTVKPLIHNTKDVKRPISNQQSVQGSSRPSIPQYQPLTLEELSPELTIEVYGFTVEWRTPDLKKYLAPMRTTYRIKWQDDTSCWVHFDSPEKATRALETLPGLNDETAPNVLIRRFCGLRNNLEASISSSEDTESINARAVLIYDVPNNWEEVNVDKLLASYSGRYNLKGKSGTTFLAVFESAADAKAVLETVSSHECKIRLSV